MYSPKPIPNEMLIITEDAKVVAKNASKAAKLEKTTPIVTTTILVRELTKLARIDVGRRKLNWPTLTKDSRIAPLAIDMPMDTALLGTLIRNTLIDDRERVQPRT